MALTLVRLVLHCRSIGQRRDEVNNGAPRDRAGTLARLLRWLPAVDRQGQEVTRISPVFQVARDLMHARLQLACRERHGVCRYSRLTSASGSLVKTVGLVGSPRSSITDLRGIR